MKHLEKINYNYFLYINNTFNNYIIFFMMVNNKNENDNENDKFYNFIMSDDYNRVMFDEYEFEKIYNKDNIRIFRRNNYKLTYLQNINFPPLLLKVVEDLFDKVNLEITIIESYTYNNVNYNCSVKSNIQQYKFIEDIYYNVNFKCNGNILSLEPLIDKKYDENKLNEIDKLLLNMLLLFIENGYTSYVKNEIFIKKMNRINLRSFVLNIT